MDELEKYVGLTLEKRYKILEVIGEGGMAIVYKALDERLNRNVAVKIMRDEMAADEEFRRRFCAESHAVAMLSHPNIVAVYDVSHNDDIEYIVMELVDGITLKQYMELKGALPWNEVVHFSRQIAKALSHAHERGIIHRDIKPQNIMLLRDGTIKVADFGIAALENEIHESNGQTIGSIHYIAPEQARGEMPDARSDLYSLGVSMYEMLTARLPYNGDTIAEVAVKHMSAGAALPHELVENVPEELERIIMKAMSPDINERYQSAHEMFSDLNALEKLSTGDYDDEDEQEEYENPDVTPIRSTSEMSSAQYRLRRRRASRVSFLLGVFGVLATCIALFVFLWDFWLDDVFSPTVRISLPNFVGVDYQSLTGDSRLTQTYNFKIKYASVDGAQEGMVVSQSPEANRSVMVSDDGIDVELTVSVAAVMTPIPDLSNREYHDAAQTLKNMGFVVEIENSTSDIISRDYVISTSPEAGVPLSSGSTVYLVVSSGAEIVYVTMPNLIGLTEDEAIAKIERNNLSYGGSNRVTNALPAGTVINQSVMQSEQVEEHQKIILTVSSGQES